MRVDAAIVGGLTRLAAVAALPARRLPALKGR
jgi:hypothetical protein